MIDQNQLIDRGLAIKVTNIVKDFKINHRVYGTLKAQAISTLKRMIFLRDHSSKVETKRALNDVSFEIPVGQVVALVGRNGSGKSTLLSILSRIYLPSQGEMAFRGRLASLLELGIGFNEELTGIENLFFACQIRGLTASEVFQRFQKIIEFAELDEMTMGQPLRTYSSGMQARLAFATAIHVDADIIIVDEGLAVGDSGFQQKCFNKILEFKNHGKTILMVAHSADLVRMFADRVIWLNNGKVEMDGAPDEVMPIYAKSF